MSDFFVNCEHIVFFAPVNCGKCAAAGGGGRIPPPPWEGASARGGGGRVDTKARAPPQRRLQSLLIPALRPVPRHSEQRPRSSAAVGFVFGRIGFVFDLVKSPIAMRSCSNINSLLTLRLEQVFPNLASFGAFHDAPDCQVPKSWSGFSLTISPRPRPDGFAAPPPRFSPSPLT
jgi:hypothetical protein